MGSLAKNFGITLVLLALFSLSSLRLYSSEDSITDTLEAVTVCPSEEMGCQKKSCLEMCLDEDEAPLDCEEYCNQST